MDPTFPLVPIANFFGCFLVLISISPGIFKSWNVGVCMFALWIAVESFQKGVNTIIWKDNVDNVAPVWCDITTHIDIGALIGVPACSFVITRRLYKIICHRNLYTEGNSKRNGAYLDLLLCLGLPLLVMGLYYIIQGARFEIWEGPGCSGAEFYSGVSIILVNVWQIIPPLISVLFYCPVIFLTFFRQRKELSDFLESSSSVNSSDFWRVLALGCLDALVTFPLTLISVIQEMTEFPLEFYQGWTSLHTYWKPHLVPEKEWEALGFWAILSVKWDEWINPLFALVFFLLFGTTAQARERYWRVFWLLAKPFGYKPPIKPEASDVVFGSGSSLESRGTGAMSGQGQSVEHSRAEIRTSNRLPGAEEGHVDFSAEMKVIAP